MIGGVIGGVMGAAGGYLKRLSFESGLYNSDNYLAYNDGTYIPKNDGWVNNGTLREYTVHGFRRPASGAITPNYWIEELFIGAQLFKGSVLLAGSIRGLYAGKQGFNAVRAFKNAISPFKGGNLTNAGRAVTKHPEYFGFESTEALMKVYRTSDPLNNLGSSTLKEMLRTGVRTMGSGGRYPNGWVTYTLQNGKAASWGLDETFIGFRGIK